MEINNILQDEKFNWKELKKKAVLIANLFMLIGFNDVAFNIKHCAKKLWYLMDFKGHKELYSACFCNSPWCPICRKRRLKVLVSRLFKIIQRAFIDYRDTQYILLTLTVKNCKGEELSAVIDNMMLAFGKLRRRRSVERAIIGFFRGLEVTYNAVTDTFHPHFHVLIPVKADYYKRNAGLYITQRKWEQLWGSSLKVDYKPRVDVRPIKAGDVEQLSKAVLEVAKYTVKETDFINDKLPQTKQAEVLGYLYMALKGRRRYALGGILKDIAAVLDIENIEEVSETELIHDTDGAGKLTKENAPLLVCYKYHYKKQNYLFDKMMKNYNYIGSDFDMPPIIFGEHSGAA